MNQRLLLSLALTVIMLISPSAAYASTRPASTYRLSMVLPPGAASAAAAGAELFVDVGNATNSAGDVAADAFFGQYCGEGDAFLYIRKTHRYVVFGDPPGVARPDTEAIGVAADDSLGVYAFSCSSKQSLIYVVTSVDTKLQWSQPCTCLGYLARNSYPQSPVGYNSDGIALNNRKLGPAVLSFPNGAPKIAPLATNVGTRAKALIWAVGTPSGFVGTQYTQKNHYVPTVWLDGKPYRLPAAASAKGRPIPSGMVERQTAHGLRIDVVGSFRHRAAGGYGPYLDGADYWLGKPTPEGFTFIEKPRFIKSQDMTGAYRMSTDGAIVFGLNAYEEGLEIYFTGSHKTMHGGPGCGIGPAWGDSHGDILVDGDGPGLCLAEPKH
jgi:hypothetical protein